MKSFYRVAMIGCGGRARAHAPGVKADSRCRVVALSDLNRNAAEAMNSEFGFEAEVYTEYQEMLAKEKPDVVILCLWTPLHLPVFKDCTKAGVKAVLCEKPMAPTWGDCLEMARIAEETGCQLTFCHQRRFAAGNLMVRKMIDEGRFGKLLRMDLYSPPNLLDCGTHTLDQALSFNSDIPPKWVLGAVDASEPLHWFNVPAESMAAGTLVFQNGVRTSIQTGGPDQDMWGGVRVIGSEGFIEVFWDGSYGAAAVYKEPDWRPPVISENAEAHMISVIRDALDCLETGREPVLSHKKALRASEIIFGFYQSVRCAARIEFPLVGVTDNPFVAMLENGAFHPGTGEGKK